MTTAAIVNPAAGRGRAGKLWPDIERKLRAALGDIVVMRTEHPGQERDLATRALDQGADHLIAIGGDGTVNGVTNAIVAHDGPGNAAAALSTVPAGTANELARYLGVHGNIDAAVAAIAGGQRREIDLLEAHCDGLNGGDRRHYAFLAISWGSAAEISFRTSTSRYLKKLGGQFSYYAVTLIVTLTYENILGDVRIDDREMSSLVHYTGMICNTEYLGGGMRLAPGADPTDGRADLLLFKNIARKDILLQKPSWLFEGHHIDHPEVELTPGHDFAVRGPSRALVDADGETIGRLPLTARIVPKALVIRG